MRIDRYKKFVEKLVVNPADSPALKVSKEAANKFEQQLNDYKQKNNELKTLYTSVEKDGKFVNDDEQVKKKVLEILGNEDKGQRNPFLQQLVVVLDLERRLIIATKNEKDDRLAAEDLRQQLSQETNDGTKNQIQDRMDKLSERLADSNVATLSRELDEARKAFHKEMNTKSQDNKTAVNKINTLRPK